VYALTSEEQVPVAWAIAPDKAADDAVDFVADGKAYRSSAFINRAPVCTPRGGHRAGLA
jgi:hypothetical protein